MRQKLNNKLLQKKNNRKKTEIDNKNSGNEGERVMVFQILGNEIAFVLR